MDKARILAIKLLLRCEEQGYSNLVLKAELDKEELDGKDKAFVSALVYGTLEKKRLLDALLNRHLKKPCEKLDAPVRVILRSGLYQCRWMDSVPAYAAINAAVELTRRFKKASASGMVNAVLRKAADTDVKELGFTNETHRIATLHNVSDSIIKMLFQAYPDRAIEILEAFETPAPTVIRTNTLRCTVEELQKRLEEDGVKSIRLSIENALQLNGSGHLAAARAFREGWFHLQGVGSQLAALAVQAEPGQTVMDLCAAPGGKSLTIAQQMENEGCLICGEYQANRISLIEKQFSRCGVTCAKIRCADASVFDPSLPQADAVLCDVPCSGTGTLSKKPDIRYKDIDAAREGLTSVQAAILETASGYVRPGGVLVYSTCSLDPAENESIVSAFLEKHAEFAEQEFDAAGYPVLKRSVGSVLLPATGRNDGFYIAKLRKV